MEPMRTHETNPVVDDDRYEFVKHLGTGTFGSVVAARDKTRRQGKDMVAIKFLQRGKSLDVDKVKREVLNHRLLCHHHVVKFERVILTPTHLGIVMEYADIGNVCEYMRRRGRLGPKLARWLFQQLVLGVDYIHRMKVVNRDIKMENAVLSVNEEWPLLKICDFGYAKHKVANSTEDSLVGTWQLLPPELVNYKGNKYEGVKVDAWCIGLCLYKLAVGRYPFQRRGEDLTKAWNLKSLFARINALDYVIPPDVEEDCRDLIARLLVLRPEDRLTMDQIQQHPYFWTDLPEGAKNMNNFLTRNDTFQSIDDLERIFEQARSLESFVY